MPVSLEQFVKDLGLPDDQQKVVLTAIGSNADAKKKFEESFLRQEDYSKNMNALATKKAELDAEYEKKNADVEKFSSDVATWKAGAQKKLDEATAARDAIEGRLTNLAAKAKQIAADNGIPETEIEDILKAIPAKKNGNDPDPERDKKYLSREEFDEVARTYVQLPAIMLDVNMKHSTLFGGTDKVIEWPKLVADAQKNKRTIENEWKEQFKVEARQKELSDASVQKRIDEAVKDAETRTRSEILAANPNLANQGGGRKDLPGSPVLTIAREHAKGTKPDPNAINERRGVAAAITKFNEGAYATPESAAVKGA